MGVDEFNKRLNEGFEKSVKHNFNAESDLYDLVPVNHGNQPNMQAAWLFNYSGKPWLTQKWTREIMNRYYGSTPLHGWLGDEDEGQMGAWFVMAAIGLFETDGGVFFQTSLRNWESYFYKDHHCIGQQILRWKAFYY